MVCAVVTPDAMEAVASSLGPDPLRRDADPERFVARVLRSKKPIGNLLLEQDVIAGIGNVYRAEVLWSLGIHPGREGRSLSRDERSEAHTSELQSLKRTSYAVCCLK